MIEVVALMIGDVVQCYSETQFLGSRHGSARYVLARRQPFSLRRCLRNLGSSASVGADLPEALASAGGNGPESPFDYVDEEKSGRTRRLGLAIEASDKTASSRYTGRLNEQSDSPWRPPR